MLRDLAHPSRITARADIAIESLRSTRELIVGKVNAMAATPFKLPCATWSVVYVDHVPDVVASDSSLLKGRHSERAQLELG